MRWRRRRCRRIPQLRMPKRWWMGQPGPRPSRSREPVDRELYELLTELGRAGYLVHSYRITDDGPEVLALVLDRGECADVFILHDDRRAYSYRTPSGTGQDVLAPAQVFWDCPGKPARAARALLALRTPGNQGAPTVLYPAQTGLCLPAERRGPNHTVLKR